MSAGSANPDGTKAKDLKEVTMYTDGGAVPNPGRGGYGVVLRFGPHSRELSAGYQLTTNNRMELMAVIAGLEALKERCRVTLHSDSKYIIDAIQNGSAFRWRENNWRLKVGGTKKAKNSDLWQRLLDAHDKHLVEMVWVKGHAGIEDNERCDQLAAAAAQQSSLREDEGYQLEATPPPAPATAERPKSKAKTKMTKVGQACRNCGTPVIKRKPKKPPRAKQTYYFEWYLYCPGCEVAFMIEKAKRAVTKNPGELFNKGEPPD